MDPPLTAGIDDFMRGVAILVAATIADASRRVQVQVPQATRYREKAVELRQRAAKADNAEIKDELIKLADGYDDMANAIEAAVDRNPTTY